MSFKKCVDIHDGDKRTRQLSCWQQLIVLLYAQVKGLTSLRDIEVSLRSQRQKWHHLGLDNVAKSTLCDANSHRSADIFREVFYSLLEKCRELAPKHTFKFDNPLYSFDSTLISVCLSLFSWAKYRTKKGAFKIHTLLDHSGYLPSFLLITDGKTSDLKAARGELPELSPDSIILIDRAYIDYNWLYSLTKKKLFFVTRTKKSMYFDIIGQQHVPEESKKRGVMYDTLIQPASYEKKELYPETLRRIIYKDPHTHKEIAFFTNNLTLPAQTIADLYKARWEVEIFFKWIKQNLKIKSFLGTNQNAVMTQIWAAMIYYLLLSFIKFQSKCRHSLHQLTRIVSELLLEYISLFETLTIPFSRFKRISIKHQQLALPLKFSSPFPL